MCLRVRERKLDGLRLGRRLVSQDCGLEVEKSDDKVRAIVPVLIESYANRVEITERGLELERARKQAFMLKQMQQSSGARLEEALAYRWRHDRAGVDQQLCGRRAREPPFSLRVTRVAICV